MGKFPHDPTFQQVLNLASDGPAARWEQLYNYVVICFTVTAHCMGISTFNLQHPS